MKRSLWMGFAAAAVLAAPAAPAMAADAAMAKKYNCTACHAVDKKLVGPAYRDVAKKYQGDKDAVANLTGKVKKGGSGVWGPVPMPPNPNVPDADAQALVEWILAGAK